MMPQVSPSPTLTCVNACSSPNTRTVADADCPPAKAVPVVVPGFLPHTVPVPGLARAGTGVGGVWRWGGLGHGPRWTLYHEPSERAGVIVHEKYENGKSLAGSIMTMWGPDGRISSQHMNGDHSVRTSPPWWPHPPLIDLREFEE